MFGGKQELKIPLCLHGNGTFPKAPLRAAEILHSIESVSPREAPKAAPASGSL